MDDALELFEQDEIPKTPAKRSLSFMPTYFVLCALPLKNLKESVTEYEKKYNRFKMRLQGSRGIPGGKYSRLLLTLFTTEAVVRKNEEKQEKVVLHYDSVKSLMRSLGIETTVNQNEITEQIGRFATCSLFFELREEREYERKNLSFQWDEDEETPEKGVIRLESVMNVPFFLFYNRVDVAADRVQKGKAKSITIVLSPTFVEMVQKHSIPVDYEVYKKIPRTLGKDLYVWLIYRNNGPMPQNGIHISRKKLLEQFYTGSKESERVYYARLIEELKEIKKKYYADLKITFREDNDGIVLYKSPTVIHSKDVRYVPLINNEM